MADFADILKKIGRGAGIAASDLLGITEQKQEARERELEEERQRLIMQQIQAQIEATRESTAAARRGERRNIISDLSEQLRGLPDESLASVGTPTPDITPGESLPTVAPSQATDSKGRPIDVVTGGTVTGGPDVEAQLTESIAGADFDPADILAAAGGRARFAESAEKQERAELFDHELLRTAAVRATELGFDASDPATREASIAASMEYLKDERELNRLDKLSAIRARQASVAQGAASLDIARANLEITRKKLADMEPPTRREILAAASLKITGQAKVLMSKQPKLTQQDAYKVAVSQLVAQEAANPELAALYLDIGAQINEAFGIVEDEERTGIEALLLGPALTPPRINPLIDLNPFGE